MGLLIEIFPTGGFEQNQSSHFGPNILALSQASCNRSRVLPQEFRNLFAFIPYSLATKQQVLSLRLRTGALRRTCASSAAVEMRSLIISRHDRTHLYPKRSHRLVTDSKKNEPLPGLMQPPSPVSCKSQEKLLLMAPMSDVPHAARDLMPVSSGHSSLPKTAVLPLKMSF